MLLRLPLLLPRLFRNGFIRTTQNTKLGQLSLGASRQYEQPVPESILSLCETVTSCDGFADTASPTESPAPTGFCAGSYFQLRLTLDYYAYETSWDIQDSEGNVKYESSNYQNQPGGTTVLEQGCLEDGFYTFTLYDSASDGLFDPGSYELKIGGVEALSGGYDDFFGSQLFISFAVPFLLTSWIDVALMGVGSPCFFAFLELIPECLSN